VHWPFTQAFCAHDEVPVGQSLQIAGTGPVHSVEVLQPGAG
jgi:hypothetical protein